MVIRRACEQDMPGLVSLLEQVLMVHYEGRPDLFRAHTRKYADEELREIIADDERPILVAVDEGAAPGEILGYAFCVLEDHAGSASLQPIKTLYLDDLCVDEASRGRHVGTELYHAVLDLGRELGCHNVTLNVWACNPSALAFYEAMGLTPMKTCLEQVL